MDSLGLKPVDALTLREEVRAVLRPREVVTDSYGKSHRRPRYFYEVESWATAREVRLTAHFRLWELTMVDCRETDLLLRNFPHYVPCAVTMLARMLELLRIEAGGPVFVSANGGYRSPAHRFSTNGSMHAWGTAADIFRIGDTYLDHEKAVERYGRMARGLGGDVFVRPYVAGDDHLHLDLGYVEVTPRELTID